MTGFNGENWFDAQDELSKQWVIDAIPEGKTFTLRFRADKPDVKAEDVYKLIDLSDSFKRANKFLKVIYCANIGYPTSSVETEMTNLSFLKEAGVDVVAVEFGNEVYAGSRANFDFNLYKIWFEPLRVEIENEYPGLPCLVFLAPRAKDSGVLGGRTDHKDFNDAAITYINSKSNLHPTVHIYLNDRECPVSVTSPEKITYEPGVEYPALTEYYTTLLNQAIENLDNLWESTLNYITTKCPGKQLYITEWGFDNYGDIKNTMSTGIVAWIIWNKYGRDSRITALLQHNGISKAGPGMIFPVHPKNDTPEPNGGLNKRRIDYFVYQLYRELDDYTQSNVSILYPGKYYSIMENTPSLIDDKLVITSSKTRIIGGQFIYSSAGATEWMAKNSTPSYEVSGISDTLNFVIISYTTYEVSQVLPVNVPPVAIVSGITKCYEGDKISFSGQNSFDDDGSIVDYTWYDYKGAVVSNSVTCNVTAPSAGTYSYLLVVTDNQGAKGNANIEVVVTKKPIVKPRPWYCSVFPWLKSCKV